MVPRVHPLSGCRRGFESIPTAKAKLHNQAAVADESEGVQTSCLDIGYNPQLANGGVGGRNVASGAGDKREREIVGSGSGGNGNRSVRAGAEERLPLVRQSFGSSSGERALEGQGVRSVYNGAHDQIVVGGVGGGGGGVSRGEGRRAAFLREVLLPLNLLKEQRVRTIMFAYVLFAVRRGRR